MANSIDKELSFVADETKYDDTIKERVTTNRRGKRLLAAAELLLPEDVEYLITLASSWAKLPGYASRRSKP